MSEKSQEEIRKETEEFMKQHKPVGIPVTKEQAEAIKKILAQKGSEDKEAPSEDTIKQFAREFTKAQDEILDEIVAKDIAKKEAERGGKGFVSMTPEMISKEQGHKSIGKSYENFSSLISELKQKVREGDKEAQQNYRELVKKAVSALKQKSVVWEDNNPDEPSMIQNILQERNKKAREKLRKSD